MKRRASICLGGLLLMAVMFPTFATRVYADVSVNIDVVEAGQNQPVDTLYTGKQYELRVWIGNSLSIMGMTMGFQFTPENGAAFQWQSQSTGWGTGKYVTTATGSRFANPAACFDWSANLAVHEGHLPSQILLGGCANVGTGIVAGPLQPMLSLHFTVTSQSGTLRINNVLVPPFGDLVFSDPNGVSALTNIMWNPAGISLPIKTDVFSPVVAHWSFDEGAGNIAFDAGEYGNDGVLTNGPLWTIGRIDSAVDLDGIDDLIYCGDDPSLDIGGDFTIAAWVRFDAPVVDLFTLMSKNEGPGSTDKWVFGYAASYAGAYSALVFYFNSPGAGAEGLASSQWIPTSNAWHHVAVTRSGTTFTFYVNGAARGQATASQALPVADAPLELGVSEGSFHWGGAIDDVRIYGRGFSPGDIGILYKSGVHGDANGDGVINTGDAVYIVSYIFRGGSAPIPLEAGDANCDGVVNIGDAVYVVNYIFRGGPQPGC